MDLSMRWLKDYVDIGEVSMRDFSEAMSMSGSKVEGWKTEFDEVKNVVVGKILSVEKHPDSDHLVICQLDVGQEEPVQIVTGASQRPMRATSCRWPCTNPSCQTASRSPGASSEA